MAGTKKVTCKEAVRALFRNNPNTCMTPTVVARKTGFGLSTVHRALSALDREDEVVSTGNGAWELSLADGGKTTPQPCPVPDGWRDLGPAPATPLFEEAPRSVDDAFTVVHYETVLPHDLKQMNALEVANKLMVVETALDDLEAEKLRLRTYLQGFKR